MTDTTPAPAEQAPGTGASALDADAVDPTMFIPQGTRDNYAQIARDQAAIRGIEPRAVMQELAGSWQELHERQPLDGYDHLAAWARTFDPAESSGPSGLAVLQARVIESARRDPFQAAIGDQAAVDQAVTAQRAQDDAVAGAAAAPSVDPAVGLLPNPGPVAVPGDVLVGAEGAEVMQGEASPGVETPDDAGDAPSTTTGGASPSAPDTGGGDTPADAPSDSTTTTTTTDTTTSSSGGGGKRGGGSASS